MQIEDDLVMRHLGVLACDHDGGFGRERVMSHAMRNESDGLISPQQFDENTARGFDKLLWTYQAIGFVPHCMAHHALSSETPVVIAREDAEMAHYQVILNLHADSPPSFSRFERLVELVGAGYEINHFDLSKSSV